MNTALRAALITTALGCALFAAPIVAPSQDNAGTGAKAVMDGGASPPTPDDAKAQHLRGEIERILAQSQFKSLRPGERKPLPRWLRLLRGFWEDLWSTVSGGAARLGESNPWAVFVVIGLCALVLLEMLRRVLRDSLFYAPKQQDGQDKAHLTPEELLSRAAQAHRDGNDPEALRLVFHAALLSLFGEAAEQTPSLKLAAELAAAADAPVDAFQNLNRSFERAFYGGAEVRSADYEQARSLTATLRRFAGKGEDDEA
jgi:hypothetical protein